MSEGPPGGTARGQVPARVLDLSRGGALFVMAAALEVGAIHDFALDLNGENLWVQGEVRHCNPAERGGYHVGVQFVGIAPHDRQKLEAYLEHRR